MQPLPIARVDGDRPKANKHVASGSTRQSRRARGCKPSSRVIEQVIVADDRNVTLQMSTSDPRSSRSVSRGEFFPMLTAGAKCGAADVPVSRDPEIGAGCSPISGDFRTANELHDRSDGAVGQRAANGQSNLRHGDCPRYDQSGILSPIALNSQLADDSMIEKNHTRSSCHDGHVSVCLDPSSLLGPLGGLRGNVGSRCDGIQLLTARSGSTSPSLKADTDRGQRRTATGGSRSDGSAARSRTGRSTAARQFQQVPRVAHRSSDSSASNRT